MANLTRYKQKIFAENSNQVGVFGTGVNKVASKNVETLQSADYASGWSAAIITSKNYPIWQERDGVDYGFSYQLAYLLQKGVPDWLATETYYTNDFCKSGSDLYYSLVDNNTNHAPESSPSYWQLASGANKDLTNLTTYGNNRLHALKSYEDAGELLTDAEGLADVKSYAHSTFDLSKFTVVGTPTISADGVASGFSSSNYITKNLSITPRNNFEIDLVFTTPSSLSTNQFVYFAKNTSGNNYSSVAIINGALRFRIVTNNTVDYSYTVSTNTRYYAKLIYSSGTAKAQLSTDGVNWNEQTLGTVNLVDAINVLIIGNSVSYNDPWGNSIDLKQFSITADGIPVFSGNKTGIDTIKPDNYTKVGSPTISADGVASGFSGSNQIKSTYTINAPTSLTIKGSFTFGSDLTTNTQSALGIARSGTDTFGLEIRTITGSYCTLLYANGSASHGALNFSTTEVPRTAGTTYNYIIVVNGTSISITINGVTKTANDFYTFTSTAFYIGTDRNGSNAFDGSIDLNYSEVYVDGNLVYQPCLKIPYTLSKTGSKVVDWVYRDRVSDMYNQFGYAPYYTLSDTNFTLPQGELYGMITKASDGSQCMPSERYIALTLGVSGSTYTAPANGWVQFTQSFTGGYVMGLAVVYPNKDGVCMQGNGNSGGVNNAYIPVSKGQTFKVFYDGTLNTSETSNRFEFIYAQGSESEA